MKGSYRALELLVCGWVACAFLGGPAFAEELRPWATAGCTVSGGSARVAPGQIPVDRNQAGAGQVARISAGFAIDGSAVVHAVVGDLDVMKKVAPTGAYSLRLRRGEDAVEIRTDGEGVMVSRGGQFARIALETAGEEELLAVRNLLAGSRSVRAFRVLGAALAAGVIRSPAGLALTLSDALVGLLDGDVTAVERLAERVGRRRPAIALASSQDGCYEKWEAEVIRAWNDYESCLAAHPSVSLWRDACGLRWILWAESAWFSFLKCAGSPFIDS